MSEGELRGELLRIYKGTPLPGWYLALKFRILPFEECAREVPGSGKVLDVGCGYGFLANYLSLENPGRQVVGHDTAGDRIAVAQATVGSRSNIQFVQADARQLPEKSFDAVVITDTLHHIPYAEQEAVLKDLFAKLKPGGVLVMRETDKRFALRYFLFHIVLETLLYIGQEKKRFRSVADWTRMLESAGYQVRAVHPNGPWSPYLTALFVCVRPSQNCV
jgi:2-polyprenyl-3-methyl-5-hydroxy-6-metoxy-1,4-benzoquinol methylase